MFGPVLAVVKFQTDAEAVALANDCPFGLGSTVFSSNRARANAIARQLQVHMLPACHPCLNCLCLTSLGLKGLIGQSACMQPDMPLCQTSARTTNLNPKPKLHGSIFQNNLRLLPKFDLQNMFSVDCTICALKFPCGGQTSCHALVAVKAVPPVCIPKLVADLFLRLA